MFPMPALRRLQRSARSLVIWCLLAAVPVYGLSGTIVELLGSSHMHVALDATARPSDPMAGWQDFRRASPAMDRAEGHGHAHLADGSHAAPHAHAGLERHHHDRADASVVGIDGGPADAAQADDGSSVSAHLLAPGDAASPTVELDDRRRWACAATSLVVTRQADAPERPPRT